MTQKNKKIATEQKQEKGAQMENPPLYFRVSVSEVAIPLKHVLFLKRLRLFLGR